VANLTVFGYDPAIYYTGRAPLEAVAMGVKLGPADVAFRCNLVTLSREDGDTYLEDFSAGHISTEEAGRIVTDLGKELGSEEFNFYPGSAIAISWSGAMGGESSAEDNPSSRHNGAQYFLPCAGGRRRRGNPVAHEPGAEDPPEPSGQSGADPGRQEAR